jgi:hypothetical protein
MATGFDLLKKQLVEDYFTPNIKAEVTFDTLLTPYIPGIVGKGLGKAPGEVKLITKEMSIYDMDKSQENNEGEKIPGDNRGKKVDFVLADDERVYLVELKTTEASEGGEQKDDYKKIQGKEFGIILGNKLISIMLSKSAFDMKDAKDYQSVEGLRTLWNEIIDKYKEIEKAKYPSKFSEAKNYTEKALILIRDKGWPWRKSSRKYLYTLGQILDYMESNDKGMPLWEKKIEIVYLKPQLSKDKEENDNPKIKYLPLLKDVFIKGGCIYEESRNGDPIASCIKEACKEIFVRSEWRKVNFEEYPEDED